MVGLPSGTVSMVFSDIEGSTVLLSRLGPSYADALDGQRRVLRAVWVAHGGTEMGTEGDSFFVVFPSAPDAVHAVSRAQRDLAAYAWPGGERVRVRMGVHTGSPTVHDGGYVGMDVHRAARIAGAAHGGQVVVSEATARLVQGHLPDGVGLRDMGSHQLKDIPQAERLFQLTIDGLQADFPALKTLGAASSLPRPATPLVGRDGELAELAAVLGSPGVRLVTLTGPGGSGKTRLAVGLARRLVESFPDGVYFVPLAGVTVSEVMWTTIGEVLDVPPEGRVPPGFFTHVAHRSALFVLDNLEQIPGADEVVSQLLAEAPQVVAVATSRRPLHVGGEHEHPVPPLELPESDSMDTMERSGAVQLFVQHAQMVSPRFRLTDANTADVAAVCRRLDGLPLAIELAAARVKLLSPHALLNRLHTALDITATDRQVPSRQQTLRDTIGWSYRLLTPDLQTLFRRLGVFAGGADLDAISAVTSDDDSDGAGGRADPLEMVAGLVDASLLTIGEDAQGEPRVGMLETVRAYALDQLAATGELDAVRERHAEHYLGSAEGLSPLLRTPEYVTARTRFETEHDNLREALAWAVQPDQTAVTPAGRAQLGLRLCAAAYGFWRASGYFAEGRRSLERTIDRAGASDGLELARCLGLLAITLRMSGAVDRAHEYATAGVNMHRRLHDTSTLPQALSILANIEADRGHPAAARPLLEEAVRVTRETGNNEQLLRTLGEFANLEGYERNYQRALQLGAEALVIARELGDRSDVLTCQHNMACILRQLGRVEEAQAQMHDLIPQIVELNEPDFLVDLAEDYAAILADLGDHHRAVRLFGAADATRERLAIVRPASLQAETADSFTKTHAALTPEEWNAAYQGGRSSTIEDALTQVHSTGTQT
jgi:predicted ATPase/class 3 adenylate cyclase